MSIASFFGRLYSWVSRAFAFARVTLANLLVILVVVVLVMIFASGTGRIEVADASALLLDPGGAIVKQAGGQDPLALLSGGALRETPLKDVLSAIDKARTDDRIVSLVLDVSSLGYVAPAQLEVIGDALEAFRVDGKTIVAKSDFYDRDQYYLASFADEVIMHPLGEVMIAGYGTFRSYYAGLLDKLKVNIHVFRVGTYKAFVEPYTRGGMSDEAKQASRTIVDGLWNTFVERVAGNRGLDPADVIAYANRYDELLRNAGGDTARLALDYGLIDKLLDPEALSDHLKGMTGGADTFTHVAMGDYVDPDLPPLFGKSVAVIPLTGTILTGDMPRGYIGADTVTSLLADIRDDPRVGAVVLRIDSGGGSAFASELIRAEVARVQAGGIPVVVSMAGTAASGGYWIAATADEIWAAPTTVTGSIGIFAIVPTFEEALDEVGVRRDGVATGPFVGALDPMAGVGEAMARALQSNVEYGYRRFIDLVARGRGLPHEDVESIAQGRVWLGAAAQGHGLVDKLGHLDDAIASAAALAGLDDYQVRYMEEPLSPQEILMRQFLDGVGFGESSRPLHTALGGALFGELKDLGALNDPQHIYALCEACPAYHIP
ncbi:MAG: signal peptide peptidase SppA [Gammaproteobacteria bacterium]|nr:signal peptide peptidase SppA [Gammaproteobacteria bacterium]